MDFNYRRITKNMHYEGTFNKHAMMEEMSVYGNRDKSLRKFSEEGVARLIYRLLILLRGTRTGGGVKYCIYVVM